VSVDGSWVWATSSSGLGQTSTRSISAYSDGSMIVIGCFSQTVSFGSKDLTSAGGDDLFAAKVSADGLWSWATSAGGVGADCANSVTTFSDGSAVMTGSYRVDALFGAESLSSLGDQDVFVAKLSPNGNWVWAVGAGGRSFDTGSSISAFSNGTIVISGSFAGSVTFGSTVLTSDGGYRTDVYVAQVSALGRFL